jgi:hypothetical protein
MVSHKVGATADVGSITKGFSGDGEDCVEKTGGREQKRGVRKEIVIQSGFSLNL